MRSYFGSIGHVCLKVNIVWFLTTDISIDAIFKMDEPSNMTNLGQSSANLFLDGGSLKENIAVHGSREEGVICVSEFVSSGCFWFLVDRWVWEAYTVPAIPNLGCRQEYQVLFCLVKCFSMLGVEMDSNLSVQATIWIT